MSKYEAERNRIRNTIDLFVSKGIPKRAIKSILSEIFAVSYTHLTLPTKRIV